MSDASFWFFMFLLAAGSCSAVCCKKEEKHKCTCDPEEAIYKFKGCYCDPAKGY